MIRPPGFRGAAFGRAEDGDGRGDAAARRSISARLGLPSEWACLRQVHGSVVLEAKAPGRLGPGDALFTLTPMLPMAVATADCYPVVLEGEGGTGLIHAGWRGVAAGVVGNARRAMEAAGVAAERAAIGPGIGPCCFEVGPEVAACFPGRTALTRRGTTGVDLLAAILADLEGMEVWNADACTSCGAGFHSYRRDGTEQRQVAVAWLPSD